MKVDRFTENWYNLFLESQIMTPHLPVLIESNIKKKKLSKLFIVTWNQHYWFKETKQIKKRVRLSLETIYFTEKNQNDNFVFFYKSDK